MSDTSTKREWYSYLDASSDDEAARAMGQIIRRFDQLHDALHQSSRPLAFSPDGDVAEALRVSGAALSEAIEMLQQDSRLFRADEHRIA